MMGQHWLQLALCITVASSFLFEFWPLAAAGVAALVFVGSGYLAVPAALLLDLAYGEPTGYAAYLFYPITIAVIALLTVRYTVGRYFLSRTSRDTL